MYLKDIAILAKNTKKIKKKKAIPKNRKFSW